jgi:hypothetical protein
VLFQDVSPPHAFGIVAGVSPSAEGAAETRFLALGPVLALKFIFAPASGRLEIGRILDGVWVGVGVVLPDIIIDVKEPFWVLLKVLVLETVRVVMGAGEVCEWWMDEDGAGVCWQGIHAR